MGAGRSSEQRLWMLSGKRSTRSGPRGQARSFPSGSERGLARRLEMLLHLRERRRRRRRSKSNPHQSLICVTFLTALATWSPFRILPAWFLTDLSVHFPNILEDSRGFRAVTNLISIFGKKARKQ